MSKKIIITLIVLIVLTAGVGGGYFLMSLRKETKESPAGNFSLPIPSGQSQETTQVYKDSSGFSFSYPSGIKITDMTPENYYSLLTLTRGKEALKITVKDGGTKDITFSGSQLVGAVTLGGISAKQYKSGNNLITAAQEAGIVYLIEGPADNSYWESAQNAIVSSFALSSASASGSGTKESIDDVSMEEEIVQ